MPGSASRFGACIRPMAHGWPEQDASRFHAELELPTPSQRMGCVPSRIGLTKANRFAAEGHWPAKCHVTTRKNPCLVGQLRALCAQAARRHAVLVASDVEPAITGARRRSARAPLPGRTTCRWVRPWLKTRTGVPRVKELRCASGQAPVAAARQARLDAARGFWAPQRETACACRAQDVVHGH